VPNRWQPVAGTHWDHAASRIVQAAIGAVLIVRAMPGSTLAASTSKRSCTPRTSTSSRARRSGWRAMFVAESEFTHLGGASSQRRWGDAQRAQRVAEARRAWFGSTWTERPASVTVAAMATGVAVRAASIASGVGPSRPQRRWVGCAAIWRAAGGAARAQARMAGRERLR
jgi:hypothetical protein